MIAIFSRFEHPPKVITKTHGESLTQQHFKEECDVNQILAKYVKTGILETKTGGAYLDVSQAPEYQQAVETIERANSLFDELPSNLRKEFQNDPYLFLEFVHDPKNLDRGIELGIFKAPAPPPEIIKDKAPVPPPEIIKDKSE